MFGISPTRELQTLPAFASGLQHRALKLRVGSRTVHFHVAVHHAVCAFFDVWRSALCRGIAIISALGYILDVGVNGFDDNRAEGTGAVESVAEGMRIGEPCSLDMTGVPFPVYATPGGCPVDL